MNRKRIFDAVRRLLGRGFRQAEVDALDAAIDDALHGTQPRAVGEAGVALIRRFEGCARLRPDGLIEAYPDPGTGAAPWTIGWGATGPDIRPGTVWTQEECDARLAEDLARTAAEVADALEEAPTTQPQFDALVSFHYNTGAIGRATLTRKHKAGDRDGAAPRVRPLDPRRRARAAGPRQPPRCGSGALPHVGLTWIWEPPTALCRCFGQRSSIMRRIVTAVAAIALIAGAAHAQGNGKGNGNQGGGKPAAAAQQGGGKGNGGGNGKADRGGGQGSSMAAAMRGNETRGNSGASMASSMREANDRGNAKSQDNGNAKAQGQGNAKAQGQGNAMREQRGNSGQADRGNGNDKAARSVQRAADNRGNGNGNGNDRTVVVDRRDGRVVVDRDRGPDFSFLRQGTRGLINGCPPGLAKKSPPCVPPGQVRNDERRLFAFDRPDWWGLSRLSDGRYLYDDGYLMRLGPDGRIAGYVPLLGGALSLGNAWPSFYEPVRLPDYYADYYGLGPYDSYRYADDVIYRVDPETAAITSIAALLTGDNFGIGQPLPLGYDVYNVPYGYRDRYYDTPDALYRYSDGYIYQVDPETRLIAAAIELLT